MERKPVSSSQIKSIGYDAEARQLEVEFLNGAVYTYDNVPATVYASITEAESVGKQFTNLVKGKYAYRRVA